MAIPILNNLDLNQNQALNLRLHNLASAPGTPVGGQVYYNTGNNRPSWYDAGASVWRDIYPFSTTDNGTAVLRDGSGNFTAGTITANLVGNASTASALTPGAAISITGKATAAGVTFTGAAGISLNITALSVAPGDISLTNGNFLVGNASNVAVATAKSGIALSGFGAPTADVAMGGFKITGLADPAGAQDAATKNYVDSVAQGLDVKQSVRILTTSIGSGTYSATAGTSSKGQLTGMSNVVDGVTLAANDRVLVNTNAPTGAALNGIWAVTTVGSGANGVWNRASDFINDSNASNVPPNTIVTSASFAFVEAGTSADTGWVLTTDTSPIVVGGASGSALAFTQFSGAGSITEGNGLVKVGSTLHFAQSGSYTANTIPIATSGSAIGFIGAGSANQVLRVPGAGGAPAFGAINLASASAVTGILPSANGGTGSAFFGATGPSAARSFTFNDFNCLIPAIYTATITGNGSTSSFTVTHNFGSRNVTVQVYQSASPYALVFTDVEAVNNNAVTVRFASNVPNGTSYRVIVIGFGVDPNNA